jgi:hypothetical protein
MLLAIGHLSPGHPSRGKSGSDAENVQRLRAAYRQYHRRDRPSVFPPTRQYFTRVIILLSIPARCFS